jgi:hypothetical protein
MSQENQFDRHFKNRLGDYASPVGDELWDGVLNLQKKKKRRRLIVWITACLGVVLLFAGGWFFYPAQEVPLPEEQVEIPQAFVPGEKRSETNTTITQKAEAIPKRDNQKPTALLDIDTKDEERGRVTQTQPLPPEKRTIVPNEVKSLQKDVVKIALPADAEESTIVEEREQNKSKTTFLSAQSEILKRSFRKVKRPVRVPWLYEQENRSFRALRPGGCPVFNSQPPPRLYLEALAGPGLLNRTLEAKGRGANNYEALRDATERSLYSLGGGLRASLVTGNGMAFRTGLYYQEINERFEYEEEGEEHMKIVNVYDQEGNLVRTDTSYENALHQYNTRNQFRSLDIPFVVGYEVESKRWSFGLNAAAYLNVFLKSQGRILVPSTEQEGFQTSVVSAYPAFKDQLGISFGFNATISYKLTSKLHWIAEPNIRILTQSVTRNSYPLDQRYAIYGLWTGLRYKI